MKMGFYAAYAEAKKGKSKHEVNLLNFINNKITSNGGHSLDCGSHFLYMHRIDDKNLLFTKTNDRNLIQKINKSKASVEDIKGSLAADESLGFPSFVFIDGDVVGFARTMYGPTTSDLTNFVIAKKIPTPINSTVHIEALMRGTTEADVMAMQFIGRTTVKVEAGTGVFDGVLKLLGAKEIESELFDSIEVIIKPKFRRDIKTLTKDIVSNQDKSYSDVSMRAKEEAGDILAEHYLSEKGHLSVNLEKSTNAEIAEEISYCFTRMRVTIMDSFNRQIGDILKQ
ncbi:TPA: protein rexA [Yersinia enterocolitica]|nr:protein rexA [Yersinia enterocolitica]EKN3982629.1 protein rexA [Yersinia enterocolitica]EKN4826790.1 protein rexA [Yersinia enterocolitica]EKN5157516.1 protein rexA [Yersinia enterocolitica]HDL7179851.1 protein rexA [Yersinia enterocolitica]